MNARTPFFPAQGLMEWTGSGRYRKWTDGYGGKWSQDFFIYRVAVGALNAGATFTTFLPVQADSAFELVMVNETDTQQGREAAAATIQITDSAGRFCFDNPAPVTAVCGDGAHPHMLPVVKRFAPRASIGVTVTNYDSAINFANMEVELIGRKILPENSIAADRINRKNFLLNNWRGQDGRLYAEDYFAYVQTIATLVNNGVTSVTTNIQADSDFEWINTMSCGFTGNATTGTPQNQLQHMLWNPTDGSTGRALFYDSAVPPIGVDSDGSTGWSGEPFPLPIPRPIKSKAPFTVSYKNISGGTLNSVYFVFEGRKIFDITDL